MTDWFTDWLIEFNHQINNIAFISSRLPKEAGEMERSMEVKEWLHVYIIVLSHIWSKHSRTLTYHKEHENDADFSALSMPSTMVPTSLYLVCRWSQWYRQCWHGGTVHYITFRSTTPVFFTWLLKCHCGVVMFHLRRWQSKRTGKENCFYCPVLVI